MRVLTFVSILFLLSACADPATMFAGGLRGWCKTASENCTVHDTN
ncbi:hypothetical protein [Ferrovibrio sp.]|jgi:hypothetical protein